MTDTLEEKARRALVTYCLRGLVFVVRRGPKGELEGHGSGTLWRLPGRRSVVLTVKHLVRDHRSFTVGNRDGDVRLRDVGAELHPKEDLAVIPLPESNLDANAFDREVLADAVAVPKKTALLVCGYPEELSFVDNDHVGELKRMSTTTYFTSATGSDNRAISIWWEESEGTEEDARPFARVGIQPGKRFMPQPRGISGGAAWMLSPQPDRSLLWTAAAGAVLVGVPHQFNKRRQAAVAVWRWKDWLLEQLATQPLV